MGLIENHCVLKNLSVFKKIVLLETFKKEWMIGNLFRSFLDPFLIFYAFCKLNSKNWIDLILIFEFFYCI